MDKKQKSFKNSKKLSQLSVNKGEKHDSQIDQTELSEKVEQSV